MKYLLLFLLSFLLLVSCGTSPSVPTEGLATLDLKQNGMVSFFSKEGGQTFQKVNEMPIGKEGIQIPLPTGFILDDSSIYPFVFPLEHFRNSSSVDLHYNGQKQTGNDDSSHLMEYLYHYGVVDASNKTKINPIPLCGILKLEMSMPSSESLWEVSSVSISTQGVSIVTDHLLNLESYFSEGEISVFDTRESQTYLSLSNATVTAGHQLIAYMVLGAGSLDCSYTVRVQTNHGTLESDILLPSPLSSGDVTTVSFSLH